MSTITVRRPGVTSHDVAEQLRTGLGDGYHVIPGMRTARRPLAKPQPATDDTIYVGKGSGRLFCAHVTIVRHGAETEFQVVPGGLGWETVVNSLGIVRRIQGLLAD
ncbi:hypothetical protein ABZX95_45015 [Streptomyces sp. NPDC004232]|uniref:hypothetical protein n=1 Tax=Streptomyces sp. NPDC004232 TaxID=3154454 RepID=UPI0033BD2D83